MARSRVPIPEEFTSIQEAQEFWGQHSSTDYDDEMEDVEMELSPTLRTKLELKKLYRILGFSSKDIRKIEKQARKEHISSQQFISRLILEHI